MPNILAFAGSLRAGSWNKKLVRISAQGAREAGAEVNLIDLKEFPLPVYDADIEDAHGLPDNVHKLKDACKQAQGFLIASPEYNAGYSGVLKNLTDWLSRPREGEKAFEIFAMKPAAAMSASPGALGGNRMLASLRGHLLHLQMLVIPQTYGLSRASEAFDADGNLVDPKVEKRVKELGRIVAELAARLR